MTRDEAVTSIMNRLGNRTDLETDIITEMKIVQESVLEGHSWLPWFLLSEIATETTVADEERVELPTDFLLEDDDQALWWYDSSDTDNGWKPLAKDDLDILRERYPGTGEPKAYALRGNYFIIKPTPDDSYTLKMSYYARDAALDTDIENEWLKHAADLLIAETCVVMAEEYIKDSESAERFKVAARRAWDRLYRKHVSRQETGAMRTMGDE